jgi:hypothetical protein
LKKQACGRLGACGTKTLYFISEGLVLSRISVFNRPVFRVENILSPEGDPQGIGKKVPVVVRDMPV